MMENRVHCYFDVKVEDVPIGRIEFELFSDVCPKTCENFRSLCTGERGDGKLTNKPLHYKGVKFHRIIKDFMIQAGDFSTGSGTGGESIYGGQFEDENFELKHDTPFLLSMANKGKNTNGSQFFITTQTACHLDGKHVVFGRVMTGQEVIVSIENLAVDNKSRPLQPAVIAGCGEVTRSESTKSKQKEKKKKKKSSEISGGEEKKKKKDKKKDKHKSEKKPKENNKQLQEEMEPVEEPEVTSNPLFSVSCINPQDIPEVPRNRFLDRGFQRDDAVPPRDSKRMKSQANPVSSRYYTKSGRKVKGRGSLHFRTPSRSRSRSFTPPHWKQAQKRTITLDDYQRNAKRQEDRSKEIDDRQRRREYRHREQAETRQARLRGSDSESGDYRSNLYSESRGIRSRITTDLRTKLKDKNDRTETDDIKSKAKEDINMDVYDNLLDYEAPSENEEDNKENDERDKMSEEREEKAHRKKFTRERTSPVRSRSRDRPDKRRRSRSREVNRRRSRSRDDRRRGRVVRRSRSRDRRRRRSRSISH